MRIVFQLDSRRKRDFKILIKKVTENNFIKNVFCNCNFQRQFWVCLSVRDSRVPLLVFGTIRLKDVAREFWGQV